MKVPNIKGLVSIARGMLDPNSAVRKNQEAVASQKADKVELSSQGQTVQRLTADRTDTQARLETVALLKADFERGDLKVDAEAIAESMVGDGLFDDIIEGK